MKFGNFLILFFLFTIACHQDSNTENDAAGDCFANDPIHEYSWLNDAVTFYTQPKSGLTVVDVYKFNNEYYVAVENITMSSPSSYIFNCNGKNIGELRISYNEFMDSAVRVRILLNENNN